MKVDTQTHPLTHTQTHEQVLQIGIHMYAHTHMCVVLNVYIVCAQHTSCITFFFHALSTLCVCISF
jgi:hypothetical protein